MTRATLEVVCCWLNFYGLSLFIVLLILVDSERRFRWYVNLRSIGPRRSRSPVVGDLNCQGQVSGMADHQRLGP